MEDSFEDRGGHYLVAGEDCGPFLAELVGGEGDAAVALAIADPAKEEGGLFNVHRFETTSSTSKEETLKDFLRRSCAGGVDGVLAHSVEGVRDAGEGSSAALLHRLDSEADGEVGLTLSGSPCERG